MNKCNWHLCDKEAKVKFCSKKCKSKFYVDKNRKNRKRKAVEYKGGKCEKCGYDKCINALSFHHLDPTKKDFGISHRGITMSWDKLKKEVDKCILVCCNCHAEIHSEMKGV